MNGCKACGQRFGCDHSDAEYQGIIPATMNQNGGASLSSERGQGRHRFPVAMTGVVHPTKELK